MKNCVHKNQTIKEIKFKDDSIHNEMKCDDCGKHIKYVKRNKKKKHNTNSNNSKSTKKNRPIIYGFQSKKNKYQKYETPEPKLIGTNTPLLFGKHIGVTPFELIERGEEKYLEWVYYNLTSVRFSNDLKNKLSIK